MQVGNNRVICELGGSDIAEPAAIQAIDAEPHAIPVQVGDRYRN